MTCFSTLRITGLQQVQPEWPRNEEEHEQEPEAILRRPGREREQLAPEAVTNLLLGALVPYKKSMAFRRKVA
jgi:hypothetical protein